MNELMQLWLPILASAIGVFVASSLIHMVFKWHNSDYRKLSNEDEVRAAIRAGAPAPGLYTLPNCTDMSEMQSEAMMVKFHEGPIAFLTVKQNGPPSMGGALLGWFLLNLAIAAITAAIISHVYGMQVDAARAACLAGIIAFLSYGVGSISNGIWMAKPWATVAKDLLDAAIYGGVSAAAFGLLWPSG